MHLLCILGILFKLQRNNENKKNWINYLKSKIVKAPQQILEGTYTSSEIQFYAW